MRDSIEEKESTLGWSITQCVIKIVDVVIGRTVREEHEQQKKLINRMILDINVLNAVCNLERISTFATNFSNGVTRNCHDLYHKKYHGK